MGADKDTELPELHLFSVFKEGKFVGHTQLHPVVEQLARKYKIFLSLNRLATETRWDASSQRALAAAGDPNEAILDCAWKERCASRTM